ncbi:MAG: DNA translocase FtsK [Thermoguttaceae bacterium]|jgi:S-DNA-T family DNA segregation ATPase FtsK/SpoIIIE
MLENRSLKRDLLALALLAAVIFLAAALFTYDPADPPNNLVFPQRSQPANACGHCGAVVSRLLFEAVGIGAYYVLVSLAAFDVVLLLRREANHLWLRMIGWLLSLAGFATLAALAVPWLSPGPVIGAGGYLGVTCRALLQTRFASVGSYILSASFLLGGLLLATDYALVRLLVWIVAKSTRKLGRGVLHVGTAYAQKLNHRRSDLDDFEVIENGSQMAVRVSGRSAAGEEDDEADPDRASTGTKDGKPAADPAKALGSRVGISRPKPKDNREVLKELDQSVAGRKRPDYELPSLDLLLRGEPISFDEQKKEVRRKARILEKTFADFGFNVRVVEIQTGPVIAQFEVELEAGLRLSKITGLADDLAIALRVPSVRIVAPLPGKNTVGVEVPNNERQLVHLREVMEEGAARGQKMRIPVYLGKDVAGAPLVVDLTTLPHLLIAGRTGTGKSVCLNSIIASMLMTRRPDEVRMLMIDPKMVELSPYKCLPHLMHPVVTDMRKAEAILGWAVEKMEERYHLLARAGVRHISVYNQLGEDELMERIHPEDDEERQQIPTHIPYIVIVADELADLMMTAAKEVEGHIIRLAQKSRAVGIHLVLATQKPTVDVITGLIKSNLPARIAFQVASRTDSRVVLDEMGADKLLGNGDMLFLWPGTSTLLRGQGTYLSDDEITRLIAAVATDEPEYVKELVQLKTTLPDGDKKKFSDRDDLYESAIDIVVREGRGSVSLLQRSLGIGYGRAARLIDFMAEDGIVGPYNGSQAREILMTLEQWEQVTGQADSGPAVTESPPSGKIVMSPGMVRTVKPVDDEDEENFVEADGDNDVEAVEEEPPFDVEDDEEEAVEADEADDEHYEDEEDAGEDSDIEDSSEEEEDEPALADRSDDKHDPPGNRPSTRRWKAESA